MTQGGGAPPEFQAAETASSATYPNGQVAFFVPCFLTPALFWNIFDSHHREVCPVGSRNRNDCMHTERTRPIVQSPTPFSASYDPSGIARSSHHAPPPSRGSNRIKDNATGATTSPLDPGYEPPYWELLKLAWSTKSEEEDEFFRTNAERQLESVTPIGLEPLGLFIKRHWRALFF